jgi:hypothetical protein
MHTVSLIANSIPAAERRGLEFDVSERVCCVTGQLCPCIPRKAAIGDAFTNADLLRDPSSRWISVDAFYALTYKWERMSSWLCDGVEFKRLDRQGVRSAVFAGLPATPWAAYATTSYKKHGALWAPINSGNRRVWRFEQASVDLTDGSYVDLYAELCAWQKRGVSRNAMETMEPSTIDLCKMGASTWLAFCTFAERKCKSPAYRFMCYLLPSMEELKNEHT